MRSLRNVCVSVGALTVLAGCSASPPPPAATVATVVPAPAPMAVAVAPSTTPDLSPVAAPAPLLFTVRIPSPHGLAQRLGALMGMRNGLVLSLDQALPGIFADDDAVAHTVDLSGPTDLAVYRTPDGTGMLTAVSFTTLPLGRVDAALATGHTLVPTDNGVRRLEPSPEHTGGVACVLSPAGGAEPDGPGRLVCGVHHGDLDPVVAYLTRTLPRTPLDPSLGDLVMDLSADTLRTSLHDDAVSAGDGLVRSLRPPVDPNNPAYQQAVNDWGHDLAASYPLALADLASGRVAVSFPTTGADLTADVGLQGSGAPWVQRILDATHDAHPPVDALAHLPPGGFAYGAAALSLDPFRASLNLAASVMAATLVPHARLQAPDNTALRTAIAALFAQDRVSTAVAIGADGQGHPWVASTFQVTTPPAQFIANVRAVVAAMKHPLVARAILADHHTDVARWTVLPAGTGIPAGAFLLRMPPSLPTPASPGAAGSPGAPGARVPPGGHAPPAAARVPMELLLVPSGATVSLYYAPDARGLFRAGQASHPAPVPATALQGNGMAVGVAVVPAGLAGLFHDDRAMEQIVARMTHDAQDHGAVPATVTVSTGSSADHPTVGARVHLPVGLLQLLRDAFLPGAGGGHP